MPVVLFAAMCISGCGKSTPRQRGSRAGSDQSLTIAVIPKGTTHEFWKSIHAGAIQASGELATEGAPVNVIWKGPLREDDREQQIQVVEGFISQRVQGIVLAPLDSRALVRPVEEARRAGVPTVIIDSRVESDSIVSFVATDNRKGGQLGAGRLGELLGGKGKVLLLRYGEGSASTTERESGFLEVLRSRYPGIEIVSADQYAGPTRETAKRASENLLNRYGGLVQGIFTPNESSTIGMLLALQDIGLAGMVKSDGFDARAAVIGENGAGKSTLMSIVAGALRPDRGAMQLDDRPYAPPSPLEARRCGVALIHQELSLCPHLSVAENILLGIEPSRWGWLDAAS